MTWLLIVFGMAGPALVGEFATEEACDKGAREFVGHMAAEHQNDAKWKPPMIACAGVPDAFPEPGYGHRII
jgi:hypothetical protein